MKSYGMILGVILVFGVILAPAARAAMLDLTSQYDSGMINGAYFEQIDPRATGTGLIDPFVRIKGTDTKDPQEHGYNTDLTPEFDELTGMFTHSLLLSAVPIVNLDPDGAGGPEPSQDYKRFMLDINESSGGSEEYLSLDMLRIYTSNDKDIHDYNPGTGDDWDSNTQPVYLEYDLDVGADGDSYIELNYALNTGSGSGDMYAYIPDSLFDSGGSYVILYSHFGIPTGCSDGFEEWAIDEGAPVIPVPGAVLLGILGLGAAGIKLRKYA